MVVLNLHACAVKYPQAISTSKPANNTDYEVSFLFEYDGCKVYRFLDHGYTVYFTNCTGETTAITGDSTAMKITNTIKSKTPQKIEGE